MEGGEVTRPDPYHSVALYLLSGGAPQHRDGKETPPAAMFVPPLPPANTTAPQIAAVSRSSVKEVLRTPTRRHRLSDQQLYTLEVLTSAAGARGPPLGPLALHKYTG